MPSTKVIEFLEQAERYQSLKRQTLDGVSRQILEQMESSYRILATSQARLERSNKCVETLDWLK